MRPIQSFLNLESAGGIVLMACTVIALAWANSAWAESYHHLWETKLTFGFDKASLSKPLHLWINDGLMAIFFFVVGLEIKREVLGGELSTVRQASLPLLAAVGGMVVPAGIYLLVLWMSGGTGPVWNGWAIPMATDIAFALGVLALLGPRVPPSLKIFLTALAIADDLGAILIIAAFYSHGVAVPPLLWAAGFLAALVTLNLIGFRRPLIYALIGIAVWVAVLMSGVHATVAGVLVAMTIPANTRMDPHRFNRNAKRLLGIYQEDLTPDEERQTPTQRHVVYQMERSCERATEPLYRLEHALHPWVAFAIMPIFALANAGVALAGATFLSPLTIAIFFGLWFGKLAGVYLMTRLAVLTNLADPPSNAPTVSVLGVSALCGIGFTMSLFIANLAFASEPVLLGEAKMGIIAGSLAAAVSGAGLLMLRKKVSTDGPAAAARH